MKRNDYFADYPGSRVNNDNLCYKNDQVQAQQLHPTLQEWECFQNCQANLIRQHREDLEGVHGLNKYKLHSQNKIISFM